jgi:predicted dinucleotide-binding enzyme
MHIGIIGTGAFGATLAQKLLAAGHQVKVTNTRPPAELAQKAQELGASPATLEEVVQDVDVIFISIPFHAIAKLPKDLFKAVPADMVVVDTGNYYPFRDGSIAAMDQGQPESEWVAAQLGRPVLKAINTLLAETLTHHGKAPGTPGRLALPIAGDDAAAKAKLATLGNDLGFDMVDGGSLAESWRQQPGTPAYCTELTASELARVLPLADKEQAPLLRERIFARLAQYPTPPPHEEMLALMRGFLLDTPAPC